MRTGVGFISQLMPSLEVARPILNGEDAPSHISYLEESVLKRTHGDNRFLFHVPEAPPEIMGLEASCVHANYPNASPMPSAKTIASEHTVSRVFMMHLHVLFEMNGEKIDA